MDEDRRWRFALGGNVEGDAGRPVPCNNDDDSG